MERKTAVIFDLPPTQHDTYRQWFRDNYPGMNLSFTTIADGEKPAETNYTSHMVGKPRGQYARTYWCCLPQDTPLETFLAAAELAWAAKRTIGFSYDDAGLRRFGAAHGRAVQHPGRSAARSPTGITPIIPACWLSSVTRLFPAPTGGRHGRYRPARLSRPRRPVRRRRRVQRVPRLAPWRD